MALAKSFEQNLRRLPTNCFSAFPAHQGNRLVPAPAVRRLAQDLYIVPSAALVSGDAIWRVGYFDAGYEDNDLFVSIF
jgi:hypothetical protein